MHLKPTAGCQISTLIIEKIIVKEEHQVGKNFAVLDIFFMGYLERPPLHNCFSNIKVDI
jgi:hypothetical protein